MPNSTLHHDVSSNIKKGEFVRRIMRFEECEEAFALVDQEDWNLTFSKFRTLAEIFPASFLVTVKRDTKEIVATVSAIPTHPGQYIIGNLVVRQDHRGRDLGKAMILHLLKHIQLSDPFSTTTLTAVPGTEKFYSKFGFKVIEPTHHVNHIMVDRFKVQRACSEHSSNDLVISEYTPSRFQDLCHYDRQCRGYDGRLYLSVMVDTSDSFLIATSKSSGDIVGYASGVDQESLLLVDGIYADNDGVALCLYRTLLDAYPKKNEMKIQEIKPKFFLSQFGDILPKSHVYTRMSIGPVAPVCLSKLYAVCDCDYSE